MTEPVTTDAVTTDKVAAGDHACLTFTDAEERLGAEGARCLDQRGFQLARPRSVLGVKGFQRPSRRRLPPLAGYFTERERGITVDC